MNKWKVIILITFTLTGSISIYQQEYLLGVMWFWMIMMYAVWIKESESADMWRELFYDHKALYERLVEAVENKVKEDEHDR